METTERRRGAKYMEGYLEVKESSKWVTHWVVIRGSQLFFFKDENTHITENIQGHVDIGPKSSSGFAKASKSKGKFEFEIKADNGKKYFLRASTEILRLQWVHTLGLAAKGKSPPPLFVANPDTGEKPVSLETDKPSGEREVSNTYTEVPEFNIHVRTDLACEVTDEEMQKTFVKKHNSFSDHCKKIWGRRKESLTKSIEAEPDSSRQPVSEGAESTPEPFYDEFPGDKPAWYFGSVTRKQAEAILEGHGPGRFLVRDSETNRKPGAYTLSLKHRDRCRHHKIETLPDGNLIIKQHEDKPFPNLATLMKYFVKSQEKDILLLPVINEEQESNTGTTASPSSQPIQQESYEIMNQRPPAVGCEDRPFTESANGTTSPKHPHGYENLPNKPKAQPPPLKSRLTEPVLPTYKYENLPPKAQPPVGRRPSPLPGIPDSYEPMAANAQPPVGRRPSPLPGNPGSYEAMAANGCPRNSSFDEPKPVLPPRRPANQSGHGYENLPEKPLPPREPTGEGYVNLPQKAGRSVSDPPELPARSPRHNHLGYENVPSNNRSLPPTSLGYQNIPSQAHGRHSLGSMKAPSLPGRGPPPMKRATTLPAHIIENTLGNMNINEGPY